MLARQHHQGETSATLPGLVPDTSAHHPRTPGDGPHMVASSAPCDHETEDAMPALRKKRGAGAPAHTYRSEPNDPHRTTARSRWAGTKPYGLETGVGDGRCGRGR